MSFYSQKDYEQNPKKYELFKTAVLACNISNSELKQGQYVGIRYLYSLIDKSQPRDPVTPVYEVIGLKHYLFARALCDFCL